MKKFGLPYQGSKSKLAEWVLKHLPSAEHLYDVFAGGCAVTHAALLSDKFKKVHANDITDSVTLFKDALDGKYENESRWISREDFYRLKDSDPFVRIVWSFGNNQRDYLYSREIEPYKKAVHEMIYSDSPNDRRMKFREVVRQIERIMCQEFTPPKFPESNGIREGKSLDRLQSSERIDSINTLYNEIR